VPYECISSHLGVRVDVHGKIGIYLLHLVLDHVPDSFNTSAVSILLLLLLLLLCQITLVVVMVLNESV
jgi:hypothetical protein